MDFLPYLSQSAEGHGEAPAFHVDDALGRLFDALNADGRMEMATVCVTGLHGQHSRLPDRAGMTHADLTEAVTRVPLLLRLPGRQSRGLVLARLAQGIDIAPTLADWWLREEWSAPTGRSLRPAIVAQRVVNRIAITDGWLADPTGGRAAVAVRCASEGSPLKVLLADDGTSLGAFRLASDPGERQSLSLSAAQLAALRAEWTEALGPQAACLPPAR